MLVLVFSLEKARQNASIASYIWYFDSILFNIKAYFFLIIYLAILLSWENSYNKNKIQMENIGNQYIY